MGNLFLAGVALAFGMDVLSQPTDVRLPMASEHAPLVWNDESSASSNLDINADGLSPIAREVPPVPMIENDKPVVAIPTLDEMQQRAEAEIRQALALDGTVSGNGVERECAFFLSGTRRMQVFKGTSIGGFADAASVVIVDVQAQTVTFEVTAKGYEKTSFIVELGLSKFETNLGTADDSPPNLKPLFR
jgi:hypothetical protein